MDTCLHRYASHLSTRCNPGITCCPARCSHGRCAPHSCTVCQVLHSEDAFDVAWGVAGDACLGLVGNEVAELPERHDLKRLLHLCSDLLHACEDVSRHHGRDGDAKRRQPLCKHERKRSQPQHETTREVARHSGRDGRVEEALVVCQEEVEIPQIFLELQMNMRLQPPCALLRSEEHAQPAKEGEGDIGITNKEVDFSVGEQCA
mmetsp:Transcript_26687/g.67892  ORF Transcript_26687/g.67892 Transcript_26687/m.67892 type:complete len:204 (-) Transcript_26687:838-1449(-)